MSFLPLILCCLTFGFLLDINAMVKPEIFKYIDSYNDTPSDKSKFTEFIRDNQSSLAVTFNDQPPLHYALSLDKFNAAKILINGSADVNTVVNKQDNNGNTALHLATGKPNLNADIIEFLVHHGASTTTQNNDSKTPMDLVRVDKDGDERMSPEDVEVIKKMDSIFYAIDGNYIDQIKQILKDDNTKINAVNKNGDTPLLYCLKNNKDALATAFINAGADINALTTDQKTALHLAAEKGYTDVAKELINKGSDVNQKDVNTCTPLHYAAHYDKKDLVELLVHNKADIYAPSNHGTPLQLATGDSLAVLNDAHKELEAKNDIFSAIDLYKNTNDDTQIGQLINYNPENLEKKNADGDTPLLYCLKNGLSDLALNFINAGLNCNASDNNNNSALHLALEKKCSDKVIKELLKKDVEINTQNNQGITPLMFAAGLGEEAILNALIDKGATINTKDNIGKTALHYAAQTNNQAITQKLIENGASIDEKDSHGHTAASYGSDDVKKILNDRKAKIELENDIFHAFDTKDNQRITDILNADANNINKVNSAGDTPLLHCLKNKMPDAALWLINHNADITAVDKQKNTALHLAVINNYNDIVSALLAKNAPTDAQNNQHLIPLHIAAYKGNEEIVKQLIKKNAYVDAQDESGKTPLHWAAGNNQSAIITILINHKAQNLKDNNDKTALDYAALYNQPDAAKVLLNSGALLNEQIDVSKLCSEVKQVVQEYYQANDIFDALDKKDASRIAAIVKKDTNNLEKKNLNGDTPLLYCARKTKSDNDFFKAISWLIDSNADVKAVDRKKNTALHIATQDNNLPLIKLLLEKGADVNAANASQNTVLHIAARKNKADAIELLLAKNPNLNSKNNAGKTPLMIAALSRRIDVLKRLISKDPSKINEKNTEGRTALHCAATKNKNDNVVIELIDGGAAIDERDDVGETALHLAIKKGDENIIKILIEEGASLGIKNNNNKIPQEMNTRKNIQTLLNFHSDIFTAIKNGNIELIKKLSLNKRNLERIKKDQKITPLIYSLTQAKPEIALILMSLGANTHATTTTNETALHLAAQEGYLEIAAGLAGDNGLINTKNTLGKTPLHVAVEGNNLDIVTALLAHNADLTSKTNAGKTALKIAQEKKHADIAALIQSVESTLARSLFKLKYRLIRLKGKLGTLKSSLTKLKESLTS